MALRAGIPYICSSGLPGYIEWRNQFLGSLQVDMAIWLGFSLGQWRSMGICHLTMQFLFKIHISIFTCYSQIVLTCSLDEQANGTKCSSQLKLLVMPGETPKKSANSQLFEYSSCKFDPPCLFKQKNYGSSNTNGIVNVHRMKRQSGSKGWNGSKMTRQDLLI